MARESKIFSPTLLGVEKTIAHYECFGWELISWDNQHVTMARETQHPAYSELVKNQMAYEALVKQYEGISYPDAPATPKPISLKVAFVTFLCLVVPCALYLAYKIKKKQDYNNAYADYEHAVVATEQRKKDLLNEMEQIAATSRALFFSA